MPKAKCQTYGHNDKGTVFSNIGTNTTNSTI